LSKLSWKIRTLLETYKMAAQIAIPLKKSAVVDLVAPLKRYLLAEFGAEETKKREQDLSTLQTLRQKAVAVEAATTAGRQAVEAYYAQVSRLAGLFPISEQEINVPFQWADAFKPSSKSVQSSLVFERVSLLYNIAVSCALLVVQ
jgi:BRO1-like domain